MMDFRGLWTKEINDVVTVTVTGSGPGSVYRVCNSRYRKTERGRETQGIAVFVGSLTTYLLERFVVWISIKSGLHLSGLRRRRGQSRVCGIELTGHV